MNMRKIKILLITFFLVLLICQITSYAAIEIVPSKDGTGLDLIVNTSISNSYLLCQDMIKRGESLYGTTVTPHLATNKDWGAVSYLSNSFYGTNTTGGANGIEVTINGVKYYSTTTNITGVMNWGSNPNVRSNDNYSKMRTQTSGILASYNHSTSTASSNVVEIYNNMNTKFVDLIGTDYSNKGMAFSETSGFYNSGQTIRTNIDYPVSFRDGLFGIHIGNGSPYIDASGGPRANITFRPVLWN